MTQPTDDLAAQMVRDVAELPDRTSPDDWPEAMLVTAEELEAIARRYMEKLFSEEELFRAMDMAVDEVGHSGIQDSDIVSAIRAERAGKDGRCNQCGATPIREVLDGDPLCQKCCDAWCRAEGRAAADREEPPHEH